jgi:hypothetical protein
MEWLKKKEFCMKRIKSILLTGKPALLVCVIAMAMVIGFAGCSNGSTDDDGSIHHGDGSIHRGDGGYAGFVFVSGNDVYIAGNISDGSGSTEGAPVLWKNGVKKILDTYGENERRPQPVGIVVAGSKVYIPGHTNILNGEGPENCLWIVPTEGGDVTKVDLDPITVTDIALAGDTVYILGSNDSGNTCYWTIPSGSNVLSGETGTGRSYGQHIAVDGTDVYFANSARYWKHGDSETEFINGMSLEDFAVSNGTVYVTGYSNYKASYSIGNDTPVVLGNAGSGDVITISGGYIYIAGDVDYEERCYWKIPIGDGAPVKTVLPGADDFYPPHVYDIAVSGNDVYVVGSSPEKTLSIAFWYPVYWKNGKMTWLDDVYIQP